MKDAGVEIHLARMKHEVMKLIEKEGWTKSLGVTIVHNNAFEAVQFFTQKKKPVSENDQ